jgi:hypothetical protein
MCPATDWNGDDASLHYTNEPGYAIPLDRSMLARVFAEHGAAFDRFEALCVEEIRPEGGRLTGPSGRTDCLRAETVVSGPGRFRVFRALAAGGTAHEAGLSPGDIEELHEPATSGKIIDKLGRLGEETAVGTDRLFGRILGEAACLLIGQAVRDGCPPGVPVFLAGKPSRALPLFAPSAKRAMDAREITNPLQLSRLEQDNANANLLGAAFRALSLHGCPAA